MAGERLKGRPPSLHEAPQTAAERFGWICRVLREYSNDMELQATEQFTRKLSGHLDHAIKPETVNRMETGSAPFTADRLIAYEKSLALQPGLLLDAYVYLHRLEADPLQPLLGPTRMSDSDFYDLHHRSFTDPHFTAYDWLSYALELQRIDRRRMLSSERVRSHLAARLLDDFASSFEREERLLREAVIQLAGPLSSHIVERVRAEPIRLYNVVEAFGFVRDEEAWDVLLGMAAQIDDGVQAQTLIEPVRRWVRGDRARLDQVQERAPQFQAYCEEIIGHPDEAYTSREEALAYLRCSGVKVSKSVASYARDAADEIDQLQLRPVGTTPTAISRSLRARSQRHLAESRVTGRHGATKDVPGLHELLHDALFARDRVERLGVSLALSAIPFTAGLCRAAGELLLKEISPANYGVQRSVIRFMTKLDDRAAHPYFSAFAQTRPANDGVKLTIAWALGAGTGRDDEQHLRQLTKMSSPTTRRVVTLSAARRGFEDLLGEMGADRHGTVRAEARHAIKRSCRPQPSPFSRVVEHDLAQRDDGALAASGPVREPSDRNSVYDGRQGSFDGRN